MKTRALISLLLLAIATIAVTPIFLSAEAQTPTTDVYTISLNSNATGCSVNGNPIQDTYQYNDSVQLTPVAADGYTFSGWSGDVDSTDNPLTVYMTSNLTINALFTENTYNLVVYTVGNGTVTPNNGTYTYNATANLTATPADGWYLGNWSDGTTSATLNITMTSDRNVTATFVQNQTTPTPTPSPTPTASPTPTPVKTTTPSATAPLATDTPTPSDVSTSSFGTLAIAAVATVMLVGLIAGLLFQKKRKSTEARKKMQMGSRQADSEEQ